MGTRKEPPLQNILTSQKYLNSQKKSSFLKFCFPLLLPKPVLKKMFLRPLFFLPLDCALCVFLGQAAICLKREEENLSSLMTEGSTPLCPFSLPIHRTLQAQSLPHTAALEQGKPLQTAQKLSLSPCWKWVSESGCSPRHAVIWSGFLHQSCRAALKCEVSLETRTLAVLPAPSA